MDALYRGLSVAVVIIVPCITYLVWSIYKDDKIAKATKNRCKNYVDKLNNAYTEEKLKRLWEEMCNDKNEVHSAYRNDISNYMLIINVRLDMIEYIKDNPL